MERQRRGSSGSFMPPPAAAARAGDQIPRRAFPVDFLPPKSPSVRCVLFACSPPLELVGVIRVEWCCCGYRLRVGNAAMATEVED